MAKVIRASTSMTKSRARADSIMGTVLIMKASGSREGSTGGESSKTAVAKYTREDMSTES